MASFEQAFKNIDDILWKEAGCTTELDYTEQTSWLLFLKYLDGLEQDKADEAALEGKPYNFILDEPYRWESWAAPKDENGNIDHNKALVGDDLRDFVDRKLFPYLHDFKQKADNANTIEYKIGQIFSEIKNKIHSGYNLRGIIDHIDELRFRSQTEKHELSHLYEAKIKNMGKTNPLNDADLVDFIELQKTFTDSPKSWRVDVADIDKTTFDLSVKNSDGGEEIIHRSPFEIMDEITALDAESADVLTKIRGLL